MSTVILPSDPATPLDGPSSTTTHAPPTSSRPENVISIATRKSTLARVQTAHVSNALTNAHPHLTTRIVALDTAGDVDKTTALHSFNAKALWTTELEALLARGDVDMIVHSLKDMPTQLPDGMELGCVMAREDARDAVVIRPDLVARGVRTLAQLEAGSVVGTSSLRRSAQLKRRYDTLVFKDCRGNVGTRLMKLDQGTEYAALILAAAGLQRLGLGDRITQGLSWVEGGVMHAVGQGALGIEIRGDDARMRDLLEGVADERAWRATLAERSVMRTLEGGCSVPIGVETEWVKKARALVGGDTVGIGSKPADTYHQLSGKADTEAEDEFSDELMMRGIVVSLDGQQAVEADIRRLVKTKEEADQLGWDLARKLVDGGAAKILEEINLNRQIIHDQGDA